MGAIGTLRTLMNTVLKALFEKDKMLVTSTLTFSQDEFLPFSKYRYITIFCHIYFLICCQTDDFFL